MSKTIEALEDLNKGQTSKLRQVYVQSASHHQKLYETLFISNCSVNQTHDQVGRNRKLLYVGFFF